MESGERVSKIVQICPQCYSDKVHVKIGASTRQAKNIDFSSTDDFYECPSCSFYGNSVLEGNDRFIAFLRDLRLQDELLKNPVVDAAPVAVESAPAQTQLIMLE